jgi:hypothetical protein
MNPDFIGFFVGQIHQYSRIVPLGPAPVTTAKLSTQFEGSDWRRTPEARRTSSSPADLRQRNNPAVAPLMIIAAAAL